MALFLPPSIVIDVWMLFEPAPAPSDEPSGGADGPAGDAAVQAAALTASDPPSDTYTEPLYDGYHLVPAYFWHREDNGFSMPWQHLVDTQIDADHPAPEPKPHAVRAPHAPDETALPPETAP